MDPLAARSVVVQNVTQAITSLALQLFTKRFSAIADVDGDCSPMAVQQLMEQSLMHAVLAIEAMANKSTQTLKDAQRIATVFGG